GTNCGADDVYRIRFYDTTGLLTRFNNAGTQSTVVILQNAGSAPVAGRAFFWSTQGALLGSAQVTLPARGSQVIPTSQVPGVAGQGGSITVAHDGAYGVVTGKAVSLDPSGGLAFDTPMQPRPR